MIEEKSITRDDVLALDIAEHCGYYSTHGYGTWNFTQRTGKNAVEQHLLFRQTIEGFIRRHGIKQVVAEDVCVSTHFIAARKLSELRGVLCLVCAELGMSSPRFVNVSKVKKWATGYGNADKRMMMESCKERWGVDPKGDDNIADACHIFKYYVRTYNL